MVEHETGLILKGIGGFYYVEAANAVYECKARGHFRKQKISPLAGDRVEITINPQGEHTIDAILPRKNSLIRPPVANLDQLMLVISTCSPQPSALLIDKLIAIAESKSIAPVLVFTKEDLQSASKWVKIYRHAGFPALAFSAVTGEGLEEVKQLLKGKLTAFCGNSGAGKSTLLNAVDQRLGLSTGEISEKLGRGRHTTRQVELFHAAGGLVADTPGFSSLDMEKCFSIDKEELPYMFREFVPFLGGCRFTSCGHTVDKGCAVLEALARGHIEQSRHESYCAMFEDIKNQKEWERK